MPTITKTVQVKLTPEDIAVVFCEMFSDDQARFFNRVAELVKEWDEPFSMQLQAITEKGLTPEARFIMRKIGECAEEPPDCKGCSYPPKQCQCEK